MKSLKITPPAGYEIDTENSTLEEIVFKPINITYTKICKELFKNKTYYTTIQRLVICPRFTEDGANLCNNVASEEQVHKILALNKLMNIAYYYNKLHDSDDNGVLYGITYHVKSDMYSTCTLGLNANYGVMVLFKRAEDAQAVIDNPDFRNILDTVYK